MSTPTQHRCQQQRRSDHKSRLADTDMYGPTRGVRPTARLTSLVCRRHCSMAATAQLATQLTNGSVIVSTSRDIFANLSVEDWLYRNSDLSGKTILLMWRNDPSVVIGRHQNPWRECHVSRCVSAGTAVARRMSGGGTVYHDFNNLNLSFICDKRLYNRLNNLTFVRNVLTDRFGIDCHINSRQDLVLSGTGEKFSGTASKVGAQTTYHHLTLLVDSDLTNMRTLLRKEATLLKSKATESVASKTANLSSVCTRITVEEVVKEMAQAFRTIHTGCGSQDTNDNCVEVEANESEFSGIKDIEENIRSWSWIFGKTPKFAICRTFNFNGNDIDLHIQVIRGLIDNIVINGIESDFGLKGIRLGRDCVLPALQQYLTKSTHSDPVHNFVSECIISCVEECV